MPLRIIHPDQSLQPGDPLWRRVPTTDQAGNCLSDFMLLIPGFKCWPAARREHVCQRLQGLFEQQREQVVFADLNIKLNLLWITHRSGRGASIGLFEAIREQIPEAVLVASQAEAQWGLLEQMNRRPRGIRRLLGWRR